MASAMVIQGHVPTGSDAEPIMQDATDLQFCDGDEEDIIEEDLFAGDDDVDLDETEEVYDLDDGTRQSAETNKFDRMIGALEDIMMDPEFEMERETFCRSNCTHFEASAENKLIYTELFQKYTQMIEQVIDTKLHQAIEDFSMAEFSEMLDARKDELDAEVFDLLLTMGDFEAFRELMVSYRAEVVDGNSFSISCLHMPIHNEEQEDGEQRPDLDLSLSVSSIGVST